MQDRNLSAHHVIAGAFWAAGVTLVTLTLLYGIVGLGQLGLLLAGAGGVLNIRGFLCERGERERRAFELGREYGKDDLGPVRSLR